ncbi:MAG: hemerythrin domain-containing protein [Thermoflexus sp.]|jgi:hemerythrin superfamily protein|nr:hemerythrin domain-containing protein [Thermoflexus sp.]MDT7948852.1 hemerythrin domain-containing protein [Thermoflexus sp.]
MEEEARIARALRAEHRLLRRLMVRMADWIASGVPSSALRERARMLFEALDDHARFEEEALFVPMRRRWPAARHIVEEETVFPLAENESADESPSPGI